MSAASTSAGSTAASASSSSTPSTRWSQLPTDWFGVISSYQLTKEFYRTITTCKSWRANERRIPQRAFTLALSLPSTPKLLNSLLGVSALQFRHVTTLTYRAKSAPQPANKFMISLRMLTYHFTSITSLQCYIDVTQYDAGLVPYGGGLSFPALRSLGLTLTVGQLHECMCGEHGDAYYQPDAPASTWEKADGVISSLISSHSLTSCHLQLNFWRTHFSRLMDLPTSMEMLARTPLNSFSLRLGGSTLGASWGFRRGEEQWPDRFMLQLRALRSLTTLDLPPMKLREMTKLFARPIPWCHLTTLRLQGGSLDMQQWFYRRQREEGWPCLMPRFLAPSVDGDSSPSSPRQQARVVMRVSEIDYLKHFRFDYYVSQPTRGEIEFPGKWDNVDEKLIVAEPLMTEQELQQQAQQQEEEHLDGDEDDDGDF